MVILHCKWLWLIIAHSCSVLENVMCMFVWEKVHICNANQIKQWRWWQISVNTAIQNRKWWGGGGWIATQKREHGMQNTMALINQICVKTSTDLRTWNNMWTNYCMKLSYDIKTTGDLRANHLLLCGNKLPPLFTDHIQSENYWHPC